MPLLKRQLVLVKDPNWSKVVHLTAILSFVFFADSMLSYWVPTFIQESFNSAFVMGLIMGFSSVVGLLADFFIPQIIKGISFTKLLILAAILSIVFALLLLSATIAPILITFLLAMAVWGIYYEFLGFARQQFVAGSLPSSMHASAWGFMFIFRSLVYTIGPIVASYVLSTGEKSLIFLSIFLVVLGFGLLLTLGGKRHQQVEINLKNINLFAELSHWRVLLAHVWPVIILSLLMGLVDATFWTTGTVLSSSFAKDSFLGSLLIPAYMLPSIFAGFFIMKWKIASGKKRMALIFFLFSNVFLAALGFVSSILPILIIIFISSILSSFAYPLVDAVYSDIVARMGRQRYHLIGLTNSSTSVAYIVGPVIAGAIAQMVGERSTFGIIGIFSLTVTILLFLVTPKKLKLPQEEIKFWH